MSTNADLTDCIPNYNQENNLTVKENQHSQKQLQPSTSQKMNNTHAWLLTKSSQSLSELVLINKARVIPVVGPEDILPVCDIFPHPSKLVEVHAAFIFSVKHR